MGDVDELLLGEATVPAEGRPSTEDLLVQVRDELRALPEKLAAALRPATEPATPEVDGL